MFNFIRAKIQRRNSKEAREALQYFVDMLEGADLDGRALTVAFGTDLRNKVLNTQEFREARGQGFSATLLLQMYHRMQKEGLLPNAAGCAVYLHTERAMNDLTLVVVAKKMWSFLEESFPYVEDAADGYETMTGIHLDLRGYDIIPEGFE